MRDKEWVKIKRETIKRLVKFRKKYTDSFDNLINHALNKLEKLEEEIKNAN